MYYALLAHRGLIHVSGDDAAPFLQGLVSNDVTKLVPGKAVYAALLSPQGKFLHDFFVIAWRDGMLLDVDKARLPDLMKRLAMYKLRSKVVIEASPLSVTALWGGVVPAAENLLVFADPRLAALGSRAVGDISAITTWCKKNNMEEVPANAYERMRLELGVPDGAQDMIPDKSLLLEFGFEDLHGVDFNKGCYVGQEVTARSKFRGQVRKFIYQVRTKEAALPARGSPVMQENSPSGEIRSIAGNVGLAVLRAEDVKKSREFTSNDVRLDAALPGWVKQPPEAA